MRESAARVQTFYRCVETFPPVERDFWSAARRGESLRMPITQQRRRLHAGLSVFSGVDAARARAVRLSPPCPYLAALQIPNDGSFPFERTGRKDAHYTLWGSAADLLRRVVFGVVVQSGTVIERA